MRIKTETEIANFLRIKISLFENSSGCDSVFGMENLLSNAPSRFFYHRKTDIWGTWLGKEKWYLYNEQKKLK